MENLFDFKDPFDSFTDDAYTGKTECIYMMRRGDYCVVITYQQTPRILDISIISNN